MNFTPEDFVTLYGIKHRQHYDDFLTVLADHPSLDFLTVIAFAHDFGPGNTQRISDYLVGYFDTFEDVVDSLLVLENKLVPDGVSIAYDETWHSLFRDKYVYYAQDENYVLFSV